LAAARGHVDGDPDVRRSALREAREESGLRTLRMIVDSIYDIDVHRIPARGANRRTITTTALRARSRSARTLVRNEESHDVRWIALSDLESYAIDDSVRRLAAKTGTLPR